MKESKRSKNIKKIEPEEKVSKRKSSGLKTNVKVNNKSKNETVKISAAEKNIISNNENRRSVKPESKIRSYKITGVKKLKLDKIRKEISSESKVLKEKNSKKSEEIFPVKKLKKENTSKNKSSKEKKIPAKKIIDIRSKSGKSKAVLKSEIPVAKLKKQKAKKENSVNSKKKKSAVKAKAVNSKTKKSPVKIENSLKRKTSSSKVNRNKKSKAAVKKVSANKTEPVKNIEPKKKVQKKIKPKNQIKAKLNKAVEQKEKIQNPLPKKKFLRPGSGEPVSTCWKYFLDNEEKPMLKVYTEDEKITLKLQNENDVIKSAKYFFRGKIVGMDFIVPNYLIEKVCSASGIRIPKL